MQRQTELDWLRGLMLVLMTVTHLPTWFSPHFGQPFGYVSAAEGFVFLSAYLVGSVYGHKARTRGYDAMRRALWLRTAKVYAAHVALLLFLLLVLVPYALSHDARSIADLASYYVERPRLALASGIVLAYNPPLLDILPMYVLFLAASPVVLRVGMARGFAGLLVVSAIVWLFAQYDGGRHVYHALADLVGWPVPYGATGAFSFLAWQFLWLAGLYLGASREAPRSSVDPRRARLLVHAALVVAVGFFALRHFVGQVPFASAPVLAALFDKWHLGPLRLLNFAVLAFLAVHGRAVLVAWAAQSPLAVLGRSSLTVFCAHLVICLALLALAGDAPRPHLSVLEIAVVAATLGALYAVARIVQDGGVAVRRALAARVSTRAAR
jgi:hypothetical protein